MSKSTSVKTVIIHDRQDCCFERFKNIEVIVSRDKNFADGYSCGTQTNYRPRYGFEDRPYK